MDILSKMMAVAGGQDLFKLVEKVALIKMVLPFVPVFQSAGLYQHIYMPPCEKTAKTCKGLTAFGDKELAPFYHNMSVLGVITNCVGHAMVLMVHKKPKWWFLGSALAHVALNLAQGATFVYAASKSALDDANVPTDPQLEKLHTGWNQLALMVVIMVQVWIIAHGDVCRMVRSIGRHVLRLEDIDRRIDAQVRTGELQGAELREALQAVVEHMQALNSRIDGIESGQPSSKRASLRPRNA